MWTVAGIVTAVMIAVIGSAIGVAGSPSDPAAVGEPTTTRSPTPAYSPIFSGAEACVTCTIGSEPSPEPAWTAPDCEPDPTLGFLDCDEYDETDSCDFMWSEADSLDALIENESMIDGARLADCPQYIPAWKHSLTGFPEGTEIVGKDVKPGTYVTTANLSGGRVTDCYWERERGGHIIANDFVTGASKVTVTIRKSDDAFTSRGCGDWIKK